MPEASAGLVQHKDSTYARWENYYRCFFSTTMEPCWLLPNKKPSPSDPAVIPFVPLTPAFCDGELHHVCETSEWDDSWPVPVISLDLITKFFVRSSFFYCCWSGSPSHSIFFWSERDDPVACPSTSDKWGSHCHKPGRRPHWIRCC